MGLLLSLTLFAAGLWQLASGLVIYTKAELAQIWIEDAWELSLQSGKLGHKPWFWADTWPVAKLDFGTSPDAGKIFYVLAGSAGNSLAFGPGHLAASVLPGERGSLMIAAHRDTHFRGLDQLELGQPVRVQSVGGQWARYRYRDHQIWDTRQGAPLLDLEVDQLLLVTCYPFDELVAGGPLRWIGRAVKE
jgi:sortase A